MFREILFRAKRALTQEWIQGDLIHSESGLIMSNRDGTYVSVIPETVGQFTGLTDKNGKKIFEGDIVRYGAKSRYDGIYKVLFETRGGSGYFGIAINKIETWGFCIEVPSKYMEVIGNIYDNPELCLL